MKAGWTEHQGTGQAPAGGPEIRPVRSREVSGGTARVLGGEVVGKPAAGSSIGELARAWERGEKSRELQGSPRGAEES